MDFLLFSSGDPKWSRDVSDVLRQAGTAIPKQQRVLLGGPLVTRAFEAGDYAGARDIVALVPGGSRALFTSPSLTDRSLDTKYGAASWALPSSASGSASPTSKGDAIGLSVYATGGAHDTVASKNLLLPPGSYQFSHLFVAGTDPAKGPKHAGPFPASAATTSGSAPTCSAVAGQSVHSRPLPFRRGVRRRVWNRALP